MAKIGDAKVTITSEMIKRDNEISDRPVESGSKADNVKSNPIRTELEGVVARDGWNELKKLIQHYKNGEIISYSSRGSSNNVVIETLNTDHKANIKGGFKFSCVLKEIKLSTTKIVQGSGQNSVPPTIKTQTKKVKKAGLKQKKSSKVKKVVSKKKVVAPKKVKKQTDPRLKRGGIQDLR